VNGTQTVYLAGSTSERGRIERFSLEVRGMGWNLTHPWWEEYTKLEAEGRDEASMTVEEKSLRAEEDFEGISIARLIILLVPTGEDSGKGWVEIGYAFALRKLMEFPQIWIVGEPSESRFFSCIADRRFATEGECLAALIGA